MTEEQDFEAPETAASRIVVESIDPRLERVKDLPEAARTTIRYICEQYARCWHARSDKSMERARADLVRADIAIRRLGALADELRRLAAELEDASKEIGWLRDPKLYDITVEPSRDNLESRGVALQHAISIRNAAILCDETIEAAEVQIGGRRSSRPIPLEALKSGELFYDQDAVAGTIFELCSKYGNMEPEQAYRWIAELMSSIEPGLRTSRSIGAAVYRFRDLPNYTEIRQEIATW